jgi:hypothetical protein
VTSSGPTTRQPEIYRLTDRVDDVEVALIADLIRKQQLADAFRSDPAWSTSPLST